MIFKDKDSGLGVIKEKIKMYNNTWNGLKHINSMVQTYRKCPTLFLQIMFHVFLEVFPKKLVI